ncbi:MAG: response regulator transcription factor [Acidimicrobiia bacterium]
MRALSPAQSVPSPAGASGFARIRVGVFDEHEIFRRGLVSCLGEDPAVTVVADGATPPVNGDTALDVAVVSSDVLAAHAASLTAHLVVCSEDGPTPAMATDPRVYAVLAHRKVSPEQVLGAIRAAAVGLRVVPVDPNPCALDGRSLSVLRQLAAGASTAEISRSLGYSVRTIKHVIQDVQHEFGSRNRSQVVAEAVRRQLI